MSSGTDKRVRKRTTTTSNNNGSSGTKKIEPRRPKQQEQYHQDISKYVLWRRPFTTLYYFVCELAYLIVHYIGKLLTYRKLVAFSLLLSSLVTVGFYVPGSHVVLLYRLRKLFVWYMYWVGLGVASSIGLGTGLHTFLLYLGPFIAEVTLAAYECDSLEFPEPPYPSEIMCPANTTSDGNPDTTTVSFFSIMSKVRMESIMWGAGTAIGELPPYFMARASAMSKRADEADISGNEELKNLLELEKSDKAKLSLIDKIRQAVYKIIRKVGFWGILLCASIPNPLFDLAGITCGHFMVPFSTFFGATLIGKAIFKMHIQQLFVIFLFSQHHLDNIFELLARVPLVGLRAQPVFQDWLKTEKAKLHRGAGAAGAHAPSENILSWLISKLVLLMVAFFIVSIVNSLAQRYAKRLSHPAQLKD